MSKSGIGETTKAVKEYLKKTNRPYSLNDIINNLQGKYTKVTVMKALDTLVTDNIICERLNKKQKIYFYDQGNIKVDNEKLKEMDILIDQLNTKVNKLKDSVGTKESKKKSLKEHIPIKDVENKLTKIRNGIAQSKVKITSLRERCKNANPEEQTKVKKAHKTLSTEWRKRKRLASEAIDSILETSSKPKKAFLEEIGVEIDPLI